MSAKTVGSILHLTSNISRTIKMKGCFLGRDCEILSEDPHLNLSEIGGAVETVFDRVVRTAPPKLVELSALKAALKMYGWMVFYYRCDLDIMPFRVVPEFSSLVQKIDQFAAKIPPDSEQSSPLRRTLHKVYTSYSQMNDGEFYRTHNLMVVQKLLSLLMIDKRTAQLLEKHDLDALFNCLIIKAYGAFNVKKNPEGQITERSIQMPPSIRDYTFEQSVQLAQELIAIDFGLGLMFTAILNHHSHQLQNSTRKSIFTAEFTQKQALEYCRTIADVLNNKELKSSHRDYLVYSFQAIFARLIESETIDSLSSIVFHEMDVLEACKIPLPEGLQDLLLYDVFEKMDGKTGKNQKVIFQHEKELEEWKAELSRLTEEGPVKDFLQKKIKTKESLLEALDFTQMSLHHLVESFGSLEETNYCLPEYQKLYDLLRSRVFPSLNVRSDLRKASMGFRKPSYEKRDGFDWVFPDSFASYLEAPKKEAKKVSKGDKIEVSKEVSKKKTQKAKPEIEPNAPKKESKVSIEAAGSSSDSLSSGQESPLLEISRLSTESLPSDELKEEPSLEIESKGETSPGIQLSYTYWVSEWFADPRKALARPQYANIQNMPKVKAKVEAYHTIPIEVDEFIVSHGMESPWVDTRTGKNLKHLSIPCEIRFWDTTEVHRGSIGYCANENGEYFHRCFSEKSPNEMVSEFMKKGFWNIDFPVLQSSLDGSKSSSGKAQTLLRGVTQVRKINPYTIEILDVRNKMTIRIFNMKQMIR